MIPLRLMSNNQNQRWNQKRTNEKNSVAHAKNYRKTNQIPTVLPEKAPET